MPPWIEAITVVGSPATPIAQASGSGTAHPNLQPYIVLNFIVKT